MACSLSFKSMACQTFPDPVGFERFSKAPKSPHKMPDRLTQKRVNDAIARSAECELRDAQTRGLVLRVRTSGRWTWTFRRAVDGKEHRIDLGQDWTLDEARALGHELNVDLRTRYKSLLDENTRENWLLRKRSDRARVPFGPIPPPPPAPPKPEPQGVL